MGGGRGGEKRWGGEGVLERMAKGWWGGDHERGERWGWGKRRGRGEDWGG